MAKEGSGTDARGITLLLFAVVAAAQIAVSSGMIISREITLRSGRVYRFRTAPVDPYDAFRGRYVALLLDGTTVPLRKGEVYKARQTVYAVIEEDEKGFARVAGVREKRPDHGAYVRASIGYVNKEKNIAGVNLPFKRFYMDEFEAPKAEAAHGAASGKGGSETYVTVRVRAGKGVIDGLYIDDAHIREYVKTAR